MAEPVEIIRKEPDPRQFMRAHMNPNQVDQMLRHAIQFCWNVLPPERQNIEEVEKEVRRMLDRALRDQREDCERFGWNGG
jgi:hypothetical protein